MQEFVFFRGLNLYIKLIDLKEYVESCRPFEQTENQKVILWLMRWTEELKNLLNDELLVKFEDLDLLNEVQIDFYYDTMPYFFEKFFKLIKNLKYVPILPPLFTLKTMVQEAEKTRIGGEEKIKINYFKTIPEFNFYEDELVDPGFIIPKTKQLTDIVNGPKPIVQSMSILYHKNPLMWPLIFHEYGHWVYSKMPNEIIKPEMWTEIKNFANSKGIEEKNLRKLISEIFSDLYAVKCCGSNFLFAFYFQEILTSEQNVLLHLDKNMGFTQNPHPPSYIRFLFIKEEIEKYESSKNDELLKKIIEINEPFNNRINNDIKFVTDDYYDLLKLIYRITSDSIRKKDFDVDWNLINEKLYTNLSKNYPIGTTFRGGSLSTSLKNYNEKFDIDTPNRINDIIYSGWKYLILELFEKFYREQNFYPIKKSSDTDERDNFTDDYSFLIKNINYSIETSVIVSNFGVK